MDDTTCCVCLEEGAATRLPGCGHAMHLECVLTMVAKGIRFCPVCRNVPPCLREEREGSVADTSDARLSFADISDDTRREIVRRVRRHFAARRNRAIRSDPELSRRVRLMDALKREVTEIERDLGTRYRTMCKAVWRGDPELVRLRARRANLNRRFRRNERIAEEMLATALGTTRHAGRLNARDATVDDTEPGASMPRDVHFVAEVVTSPPANERIPDLYVRRQHVRTMFLGLA